MYQQYVRRRRKRHHCGFAGSIQALRTHVAELLILPKNLKRKDFERFNQENIIHLPYLCSPVLTLLSLARGRPQRARRAPTCGIGGHKIGHKDNYMHDDELKDDAPQPPPLPKHYMRLKKHKIG
nr:hypothetical protein CFP56_10800 [Quercus suber]